MSALIGAFGGIIFLVGLAFAFIGHRHMGEGPMESPNGPVQPFGLFIGGLIAMGVGVILMVYALVNGTGSETLHYSDFFPGSSDQ